jgi:hypothetical protein
MMQAFSNNAGAAVAWYLPGAAIACPRQRGGVRAEVLDDELLLIHPRTGEGFRLNATARLIWEHLDQAATTRDLALRLTDVYEVDESTAAEDVEQVLVCLARAEMLTVEGGA